MTMPSHVRATRIAAIFAFVFAVFFLTCLALSFLPLVTKQLGAFGESDLFRPANRFQNLIMGVGGLIVFGAATIAERMAPR